MRLINPKTDLAFKKIFGSPESKEVLISFLNGMLYEAETVVQDVQILNPYEFPFPPISLGNHIDIIALISGNKTVMIEMEILNFKGLEKRILYQATKAYSNQLDHLTDYHSLNPVIALTIADFEIFPHLACVINHFVLKEREFLVDYFVNDLELVFVELPKFHKDLEELENLTDQWIYFLKSGKSLKKIPKTLSEVDGIKKAFEIANREGISPEELEDLNQREIYLQDQRNTVTKAVQENARDIAKKLLNILDEETISQTTGLTREEIRLLKRESS